MEAKERVQVAEPNEPSGFRPAVDRPPADIIRVAEDKPPTPTDQEIMAEAERRRKATRASAAAKAENAEVQAPLDTDPRWWGQGDPMTVRAGSECRGLVDGGGICSPGRWRPCDRKFPEGSTTWLGPKLVFEVSR